jgi:transcriptional regulator with XRE-family HTH domain
MAMALDQEPILLEFGDALHRLRTKAAISQEELAELASLDRTYISLLERGRRNPSLTCINRLAQALNVEVEQFFNGAPK